MDANKLTVTVNNSEILVSGVPHDSQPSKPAQWKAASIGEKRLIVFEDGAGFSPENAQGFAKCSVDMLYDLITGVNSRRWSGALFVDTGFATKKIFFNCGELVFASSDLMDDRLGEVIYREAVISLDQLTKFAVQVDRKTKFGQVLLRSGIFTTTDIWHALKAQVREIFRSIFLVDHCYVEVQNGAAPMEVTFEDGTPSLLDSAYSFGAQFRSFAKRINPNVRVGIVQSPLGDIPPTGTFKGDFLELCRESEKIEDVLNRSQLAKTNTILALHRLVATGALRIEGLSDPTMSRIDARFASLKSAIDAYQTLYGIASAAFKSASESMPVQDLTSFALSLNHDDSVSMYLDSSGNLTSDSISDMLQQCVTNNHRLSYFQIRIESLTRYLLQVAGDMLPYEIAKNLKNEFKEITS